MHIFIKAAKFLVLPCFVVFSSQTVLAQWDSLSTDSATVRKVNDNRIKASGVITDASTGKPLDGISISVPGYSASITNEKGEFTISVPDYNTLLLVNAQGFQTKEVALKGRKSVKVSLYEDRFNSVYEEVKFPQGPKSYSQLSGAVSSVSVKDSWQRSSTETPDTYLQGRITGLNAIRRSGTQGIGSSLFLRGYNSLNTTNQPLIIVDGILYDNTNYGLSLLSGYTDNPLANIDLKDIDNITVVKDATASAYGSKSANGVLYITTNRARQQATQIDFGVFSGFNVRPSLIPVLNANQYRSYLSDLLKSSGATDAQIAATPFMNSDPNSIDYKRYNFNTNWQDQVLNNSFNQNYYMKVTGGDNIATYGLSLGFLDNKGVTKNTSLQRYQVRFNADLNLTKKFKGVANLSYVRNNQDLRDQGLSIKTNPIYLALTKAPFLSTNEVAENGVLSPNLAGVDYFNRSNPSAVIQKMAGTNNNYRLIGSLGFNYAFSKQLNLNILAGVTYGNVRETYSKINTGIVPDTLSQAVASRSSGSNVERLYSLFTDARLSFNKTINHVHNLSTNVGVRFNDNKMETDYGYGYNAATDDYVTVGQGQAALRRISGENGSWRWLNIYANADYAFRSKYIFSANIGIDGSSRFGAESNAPIKLGGVAYSITPSVAGAWIVSSEPFMANNKIVEFLKLRTSFGMVANDDLGNYTARQYYLSQNFLGAQGLVRGNIANTSIKWEDIWKYNGGLDASFLNERLKFSFDYFYNRTYDMLTQQAVQTVTGFDYAFANNGGMKTQGLELGINGRVINKSVKWDLGVNISKYENEITRIPNDRLITSFAGAQILTQKGMAGNLFYGFETNGVYQSSGEISSKLKNRRNDGTITDFAPGDIKFLNTYVDGVIQPDGTFKADEVQYIDDKDRIVIGNPNPDFFGMISNTISWKKFTFDALFSFSVGNDIYNYQRRNVEAMNGFENQTPYVLNRWRAEGQVTDVPRAIIGDPSGNSRFSNRWIEDGSYFRLRTLSVGYDLPINKGIKYAKVYLTGNNLFTISKYLGYDPEFSSTGSIFTQGVDTGAEPQFRSFQLGVRVGL
ncbi:SusC/RagA family TonB-linked outer membrane protein [Desertivirga arenae]|uniref:SusC/RagA family TonB-linked outer membrane protein n=1 Tax=Desertivirga arenae TaxID=2810309 RepID=UPI001A9795AC|nr:SusC/RagA family TonB-linked outer membrane protein [Pedobacter sp. SYSU D00823]